MSERDRSGTEGANAIEIDSATLEIIRNGCSAIAEEMNATLIRRATRRTSKNDGTARVRCSTPRAR